MSAAALSSEWLDDFKSFIGPGFPVYEVFDLLRMPDDSALFVMGAEIDPVLRARLAEGHERMTACGCGITRIEAEARAIGEAIERYAFLTWEPDSAHVRERAPTSEEVARLPFLLPENKGSREVRKEICEDGTLKYCVPDNSTNPNDWVPVGLLTLSFDARWTRTSNGMATAPSAGEALTRALLEVVERDTVMTAWLWGVHGVAMNPEDWIPSVLLDRLLTLRQRGVSLVLRGYAAEAGIPVVVAVFVAKDATGAPSLATVGSAASLSFEGAAVRAVLESALAWHGALEYLSRRVRPQKDFVPRDFSGHARLYLNPVRAGELCSWLGPFDGGSLSRTTAVKSFDHLVSLIRAAYDTDVLQFNMTPRGLESFPLRVFRAVVPGLLPLFVGQNAAFHMKRAHVPPVFSVGARTAKKVRPNMEPHPFP